MTKINYKNLLPLNVLVLLIVNCLLFINEAGAQWSLKSNTDDGKYSLVINSTGYYGLSAGSVEGETIFSLTTADTANWKLVSNSDNGMYSLIENKTTYMGVAPGKIRVKAVYLLNSSYAIDTTRLAFLDKANTFTGRKQTFDTVNATVKYLLNGNDINSSGTLTNAAYQNGRPIFIDLVSFTDSVAMQTGYFVPKNTAGIRYNKSLTLNDTLYSTYISTGNYIAANGRQSNLTLDNTGALNFSLRLQVTSTADGVMNVANWSTNGWSKFELGVGANATGFIRGVSDTDITGIYLHSANGSLWFLTISDAGTISVSSTAP